MFPNKMFSVARSCCGQDLTTLQPELEKPRFCKKILRFLEFFLSFIGFYVLRSELRSEVNDAKNILHLCMRLKTNCHKL